jgi:pimeloyl-ACP methyl ester carboxylesterase/dihydrofolate reductase
MRKLKIIEHMSLDGVIQVSGDSDFPYGDWTAPYRTPAGRDAILAAYGESFDVLLGRRTYDQWSTYWPKAPSSPMSDGLNAAKKYVVTHRPESLEWGPCESIGPDIVEGIRRIKSQAGPNLIVSGSITLISTLLEHGLADEVMLAVNPVLLGTGKRFFAEGTPPHTFELISTKAMPSGIIFSHYKVAGPLKTGDAEKPAPAKVKASKTGRVAIHGVDYYYETYGKGEPLLLLHGGFMSIEMFSPVLPAFTKNRQVIAVDLEGHARTALGDRPYKLETQGDDMAELVKQLGHDKVDVIGFSLGGTIALRMAIQKPERVRRLVLVSVPYSDESFYPEIKAQQVHVNAAAAPMMKETPMYELYAALAPKPEEFPKLLDRLGNYMLQKFDWSAEVKALKVPVMLVYGDSDMFRPEHQIKFYQLLGGGLQDGGWGRENMSQNRLAILPGVTHYDIFDSPQLVPTMSLPFLNGETEAKS